MRIGTGIHLTAVTSWFNGRTGFVDHIDPRTVLLALTDEGSSFLLPALLSGEGHDHELRCVNPTDSMHVRPLF